MKQLGLMILLMLSLPAAGAEWVRVHPLTEWDQYFYDRSKLYINGDEITYWKKVIFKTPVTVKGLVAASGLYRERIHCAEHTLRLISYLLYAPDGSTIEYVASHEGEAAPIIPDTVGDVFERNTCALVRQKQEAARLKKAEDEARKAESGKEKAAPPVEAPGGEAKPPPEKKQQPAHDAEPLTPTTPPPPVAN